MDAYQSHKGDIEAARQKDGKFGFQRNRESSQSLTVHANALLLAPGEGDDYRECADGDVIEDLYVERTENDEYLAVSSKPLYDLPSLISDSTGISTEAAKWTLEAESEKAREFLEKHYDATVEIGEDDQWSLEFVTKLNEDELSGPAAAEALWNRSKIVNAHNESDHGTYGTDNLGRLLADALNIQSQPRD